MILFMIYSHDFTMEFNGEHTLSIINDWLFRVGIPRAMPHAVTSYHTITHTQQITHTALVITTCTNKYCFNPPKPGP